MAKNVKHIAKALGATIGEPVPDTGGGAFGMAWLAASLSSRLVTQFSAGTDSGKTSWQAQRSIVGLFTESPHERRNFGSLRRDRRFGKHTRSESEPDAGSRTVTRAKLGSGKCGRENHRWLMVRK